MSSTATLYGVRYSPWALRAKWALDHHRVPYQYREYVPMLGTPELRVRLRDPRGRVTVPVLLGDGVKLRDSVDIARWAEVQGNETSPLFTESEEVIETWTRIAEDVCASGRILSSFATAADPDAIRDNIPGFIPTPLRPVAGPLVKTGIRYLGWKYAFTEDDAEQANRRMRAALETVANRLETRQWLGESFGWSDIAIVCALQFINPAQSWVRLGDGARRAWTREEIARDFGDVLDWRDRVLSERRP